MTQQVPMLQCISLIVWKNVERKLLAEILFYIYYQTTIRGEVFIIL
jgi:hypothetical protein